MDNETTPYGRRFLFIVTAAFVLLTIPFHLKPDNFVVDDGYFYLQIARNIALGQGSTFNGVMPTNGYHPLWMLICVCAAYFTKVSTTLIQAAAAISDAFALSSVYLFIYICKISKIKGATAGIAVIVFMTTTLGIWRMLEADLAFALQLVILALLVRWKLQGRRVTLARGLSLGCLIGLALLARLDLVFFALFVCIYAVWFLVEDGECRQRTSWAIKALPVAAACCLMVCPYLYWNYRSFGHIVPISGAIKSNLFQGIHLPLYCFPVIIACLLNLAAFARRRRSPFAAIVLIVSGSALVHLGYSILFGNVAAWYLTTGYLAVAFCVTWLFDRFLAAVRSPVRYIAWSGLLAFLILGTLETLRLVSNFTYTRLMDGNVSFRVGYVEPKRALAEKLRHLLPAGSRIYVYDGPGGIAYYSGMSVIPTDGLVADYSYNTTLLADGVSKYMADEKIDYVIAPVVRDDQTYFSSDLDARKVPGGEELEIYAPLHHRSAGSFFVSDRDRLEEFATVVPNMERSFPEVAIWRVNH